MKTSMRSTWVVCFVFSLQFIASQQCKINMAFSSGESDRSLRERFPGLDPEAYMDARELIESKGIPYEGHTVETEDGYLLGLQRLARSSSAQQYPVLIMHGLMSSGEGFLLNHRDQSLAYILYDRGFDVWLGNVRGTKYSQNHTSLDPESSEFWDWSFDEIGKYDVPAVIDHVLEVTGKSKLNYVGHSQGAMVLFSAVIQHQWWYQTTSQIGQKIANFFALAPAVYIEHTWSESAKGYLDEIEYFVRSNGNEFAPALLKDWIINMCLGMFKSWCSSTLLEKISGQGDDGNFNQTRLAVYLLHEPSGTSNKNILHWIQMERRNNNIAGMKYYDYGSTTSNLQHYKLMHAPEYNFKRYFGVKTHIYCGDKDMMITLGDCQRLIDIVNVASNVTVVEGFAHVDFVYSTNANVKVYEQIINHMVARQDEKIPDTVVADRWVETLLPITTIFRKFYESVHH